ncbi:MAG: tetratricopeptide repeat protein [Proteobacteria bacterium]|nr:tetratricopeptide repeat protein [Pseudomonadota bacterium]
MAKKTYFIFIVFISIFSHSVIAGSIITDNPKRERSNNEAMTELVYKKFVKLQEMIADEKYVEARTGLIALTKKRLNNFEAASVNHYLGWVASAEGDFEAASEYLQKAIDTDALTNQAHFGMMLQKAQMLAGGSEYQKAINALQQYYKVTDEIKDTTLYFEASIYAQMENKIQEAIAPLKKAIELSDKPVESWYYLLVNLHMQSSEFLQASKLLEILIEINPNKNKYWKMLSQIYFTLKKDDKALAILVVADKNSMLSEENDRMRLFKMYAFLDVPYKAAEVLEKGLKNGAIKPTFKRWEDLGNMWYSAAEMNKSLSAYTEASKLASDGKIDFRRAYIFFGRGDWNSAISAWLSALEKGGIKEKRIGTAWLLLGMAESELNNLPSALKYLNNALAFKNVRNSASQWIGYIEKQRKDKRDRVAAEKALAEERAANEIVEQ